MTLTTAQIDKETTYRLLDGRKASKAIRADIAAKVSALTSAGKRAPHLAAVLVGNNGASRTYVNAKVKACEQVGFKSTLVELPISVDQSQLMAKIKELNENDAIDGFIVQLPLPDHLDAKAVTLAIDPSKDVDGFHPRNVGAMVLGEKCFPPATPAGIMQLLKFYDIETSGKHCVVIGRSNIVGTPMSIMMSRNAQPGNCTVTLAHSRTKDIAALTRQADILIVAVGKAGFVKPDMVKEGAVVVDVGIHRIEDQSRPKGFSLLGDVEFNQTAERSSAISPVPGGVGPMTITSLLINTLSAAGAPLGV